MFGVIYVVLMVLVFVVLLFVDGGVLFYVMMGVVDEVNMMFEMFVV